LIALAIAGCTTMDSVPANPQAVVDQRVAIMKGFVSALSASGAFASGKGSQADAHTKLSTARSGAESLRSLFPRGTALGDRGVTKSRALSTIFSSRADFDDKLGDTAAAFAALDATVVRGAEADAATALSKAKATCGSCHNKYRSADE
jgi:cytochrome c556